MEREKKRIVIIAIRSFDSLLQDEAAVEIAMHNRLSHVENVSISNALGLYSICP